MVLQGGEYEKILVDDADFFDLASLTKPLVTSLCMLALLQEGKLHLDDKLNKFFKTNTPDKRITTFSTIDPLIRFTGTSSLL